MTDEELKHAYESRPEVARLADRVHRARLMTGKACNDCIKIAVLMLKRNPDPEQEL